MMYWSSGKEMSSRAFGDAVIDCCEKVQGYFLLLDVPRPSPFQPLPFSTSSLEDILLD